MKTAVLFTGALRTVKRTIRYLKENVLIHPDVHVFACLQNDTHESEAEWNEWFRQELGNHIKTITWFSDAYYPSWALEREIMLRHMPLEDGWKNYLRHSGSMVEYKQLQLAYLAMSNHEQQSFSYEYVIRARTDTIFAKKIDFHWISFSQQQITERLQLIEKKLLHEKMDSSYPSVFSYFMSTLLSDDLIPNLNRLLIKYLPSEAETSPPNATELSDYLRKGRYLLTIRKNLLYIVRRSLFHAIPSIASLYGTFRSPHSDHHWFNAECQFQGACYHAGLSSHEYSSAFEELPIAEREHWKEADYFDKNFNCIHPHMLYCLVRT